MVASRAAISRALTATRCKRYTPFSSSFPKRSTWKRSRRSVSARIWRGRFGLASGRCSKKCCATHDSAAGVRADRVGELGGRGDFPPRENGLPAQLERAVAPLQAERGRLVEDSPGLRGSERDALAEGVDRIDEILLSCFRKHFVADEIDVRV